MHNHTLIKSEGDALSTSLIRQNTSKSKGKGRRQSKQEKEGNKEFKPRGAKRPGTGNPMRLRLKVFDPEEKIIALCNLNEVEGIDKELAAKLINESFTQIRNGRPLKVQVLKRHEETGSPLDVRTPGGEIYSSFKSFGNMRFFSNKRKTTTEAPMTSLEENNPLFDSEPFKWMVENHDEVKIQTYHATQEKLKKAAKENSKVRGRPENPRGIMAKKPEYAKKINATSYAQATCRYPKDKKEEFNHLIGRFLNPWHSKQNRSPGNYVVGAYDFNSDVTIIEGQVKDIFIKAFQEGVEIEVRAHMVKDTQIAYRVEYIIQQGEFKVRYVLDAQTNEPPPPEQEKYVRAQARGIVGAIKRKREELETPTNTPTKAKEEIYSTPEHKRPRHLFFEGNPRAKRQLSYDNENNEEIKSREMTTVF